MRLYLTKPSKRRGAAREPKRICEIPLTVDCIEASASAQARAARVAFLERGRDYSRRLRQPSYPGCQKAGGPSAPPTDDLDDSMTYKGTRIPETVRPPERCQAEGGQTDHLAVRISKLDREPVACHDESTSNSSSADFADDADGENPRDDPLLLRSADSAIQICCVTADPAIQSLMKTRGWPDFAKANPTS